jgi:hypothetical protein
MVSFATNRTASPFGAPNDALRDVLSLRANEFECQQRSAGTICGGSKVVQHDIARTALGRIDPVTQIEHCMQIREHAMRFLS